MARGSSTLARTPMNRGEKGLTVRTPIARGKPLEARATVNGSARPAKPRTRARSTGPTPAVRAVVNARDGGLCVRCGAPASDLDHRQGRGAGGTSGEAGERINQPSALLTMCGRGNTSGCHGWKEGSRDEPERLGYRLPRNGIQRDPERVPVLTRRGWALFLNDGTRVPCPAPPDGDARNAA